MVDASIIAAESKGVILQAAIRGIKCPSCLHVHNDTSHTSDGNGSLTAKDIMSATLGVKTFSITRSKVDVDYGSISYGEKASVAFLKYGS